MRMRAANVPWRAFTGRRTGTVLLLLPVLAAVAPAQDAAPAAVLAGRVRDRSGQAAAGAELLVRWRMAPELPGLCGISLGDDGLGELRARCDDRGRFQVEVPHRGPFELTASTA